MSNETTSFLGKTIVDSAFEQAAMKAGTTVGAIASTILSDPTGKTSRYVADLIACGLRNIDTIIESARLGLLITADQLAPSEMHH